MSEYHIIPEFSGVISKLGGQGIIESDSHIKVYHGMERLREKYVCPDGNEWEVWLVIYSTDRYVPGGTDEVLQYKKNGHEVGHHTRHLDQHGNLLQENSHGITSVPNDCERI